MERIHLALIGIVFAVVPSQALAHANGLDDEERGTWYHLSQGTEFFPLDFLRALQDSDTRVPFMKNLERFGFIPDAKDSKLNPYGLPVGMTADRTRDLRFNVIMIGINCSACHTASLEFGGLPVLRADGGTNMFNADGFRFALMKSIDDTLSDRKERIRFVVRLLRQPASVARDPLADILARKLADAIEKIFRASDGPEKLLADKLHDLIDQDLMKTPPNLVQGMITRDEGNLKDATAKIQAQIKGDLKEAGLDPLALLDTGLVGELFTSLRLLRARLETLKIGNHDIMTRKLAGPARVDAFGAARNLLFPESKIALDAPVRFPFLWTIKDQLLWYHWDGNTMSRLERNTGEALGVGAILDPKTFESTIRFDNLDKLEHLAMKLTPPTWPKAFGEIDKTKATAGEILYGKHCASCHSGPKADGSKIIPLNALQTDSQRINNVRTRVGAVGFYEAQSPILKATIRKAGLKLEGDNVVWRPSKDLEPNLPEGYPNRPLPAIWASPPYLHNGSVPNLYQLLLPAEKRDRTFALGHREYDPKHLGYTTTSDRPVSTFDTSLPGNKNSGHSGQAFGTELAEEQRWELLEYLKSR
jgi:hypothetical protein